MKAEGFPEPTRRMYPDESVRNADQFPTRVPAYWKNSAAMRIFRKLCASLARPDFRRNPLRALWRRIHWRLRWKLRPHQLWELPLAHDNLRLLVPKCGAGALLYYQGLSEPDTADFLLRFLKAGMVFVDVGAHIGEYLLLAAARVGATGEVHAFEPHPEIFTVLKENVQVNGLSTCVLNQMAVFDGNGEVEFELYGQASLSRVRSRQPQPASGTVVRVPAVRLEDYWVNKGRKVDLVKIDTEGAELFVLRGARRMLSQEPAQAPVLLFEYDESNMRSFGYDGAALLGVLREHGYGVWHYCPEKDRPTFAVARLQSLRGQGRTVNLLAAKALEHLILGSGGA